MQQPRRRFLATVGLSSAATLAGCTGESGAPAPETTPDTTTTTATPAFSGCPSSLRAHADETVCAATAPDDAPVVLRPSATELSAPGTLRFTLTNGRETSIGLNPYDWAVHRKTDGGWEKVAPDMVIQPWYEIAPGESRSWALRVGADAAEATTASTTANTTATDDGASTTDTTTTSGDDTVECGPLDLGAGTYAFSVVAAAAETRTAYVARFRVA